MDAHTETEVRRLLTAAVDTIPAGADLLGGVRRRRARNRLRARAAIGAGSAAAVAAGALVAVTATGAPSALAAVTSAAAKTASESYRVSMISAITGKSDSSLGFHGPVRVTGEFDPARQIGEETSSDGGQSRYISGYGYWRVPSGGAGRGKPWFMTRIVTVHSLPAGPRASSSRLSLLLPMILSLGDTVNAQNLLTLVKSVSTVRDEGPASGPGWTGTRYSFSTTAAAGPYRIVRGTVDVDRQGRVRRLIATIVYGKDFSAATGIDSTTNDITFSDFGLRVSVTAPPASQVHKEPGGITVVMGGW